jgi:dCTP diphosphatase
MNDQTTTIADLKTQLEKFKTERGWGKHHVPKQLAITIAIEAAELLEHFQWDDYSVSTKEDWADELADVINNCIYFANVADIDIASAVEKKLAKVAQKYPTSIFNPGHDSTEDYWAIKKKYRAGRE